MEKLITFHFDVGTTEGNEPNGRTAGSTDQFQCNSLNSVCWPRVCVCVHVHASADRFNINYSFFASHQRNVNSAALWCRLNKLCYEWAVEKNR